MSNLVVSNISDGTTSVGTGYVVNGSARAWVYFNQLSVVVSQSFNISSVTDNSAGNATHNLSNSMSSTLFPVSATNGFSSAENGVYGNNNAAGTILTITSAGDRHVNVSIHGDLA